MLTNEEVGSSKGDRRCRCLMTLRFGRDGKQLPVLTEWVEPIAACDSEIRSTGLRRTVLWSPPQASRKIDSVHATKTPTNSIKNPGFEFTRMDSYFESAALTGSELRSGGVLVYCCF